MWTGRHGEKGFAITIGLTVGGRCLLFYGEIHPEKRLTSPRVHRRFLDAVEAMLPPNCKPTIVTDGGFHTSWLDDVAQRKWDYVSRVRGPVCFFDENRACWKSLKNLYERASAKPRRLGEIMLTKTKPRAHILVAVKKKPLKRRLKKVWRNLPGVKKRKGHRNNVSAKDGCHRRAAQEPWILATSLEKSSAKEIVEIYSQRMQTEENYRGLKSHQYGGSFEDARSQTAPRLAILFLIGILAAFVLEIVGWLGERQGKHHDYQANTIRDRRVISRFNLGRALLKREDYRLNSKDFRTALKALTQIHAGTIG